MKKKLYGWVLAVSWVSGQSGQDSNGPGEIILLRQMAWEHRLPHANEPISYLSAIPNVTFSKGGSDMKNVREQQVCAGIVPIQPPVNNSLQNPADTVYSAVLFYELVRCFILTYSGLKKAAKLRKGALCIMEFQTSNMPSFPLRIPLYMCWLNMDIKMTVVPDKQY